MMSKPEQESPFVKNHTKNSDIERHALATIFVFTPQENQTTRKGCLEENTTPKHRCLHHECEYETEVVKDELAAVLPTVP